MEIIVIHMPKNGFLGGPHHTCFTVQRNNIIYEIVVDQLCERKITVTSSGNDYAGTLNTFYTLESLLMLFDGHFHPVTRAFDDKVEITQSWKERILPSYQSADFMLGAGNVLLDYENVLDSKLFEKWYALKEELDLIHKMVLYCLSDVKMPKDMQCAFMSEAFIGVTELVNKKKDDFSLPHVPKNQSKLKYYLIALIKQYGKEVFEIESSINIDKFAQILVDSRNRIAHIKSKQNRLFLDGGESVMYLSKLSLFYRIILFDLLGIPKQLYQSKLDARIHAINEHSVTKNFFTKLS